MKVVLLTTGQPSINPRLVKEADALQEVGHEVIVLYCFWIRWAEDVDKILLKNVKWKHKCIGGSPSKNRLPYYLTKLRFKVNNALSIKGIDRFLIAERSQARCYDQLLHTATSLKADIYIGHNLGALPVIVNAAKYNNALCGFDFEDYHRGEDESAKRTINKRIVYLEEKYVPHLDYLSTSSPLITARVKDDFSTFSRPIFSLLNCFPLNQRFGIKIKSDTDKDLQLLWFGQTVGRNRGLEGVLAVLTDLNNGSIHLTLAGRLDEEFKTFINENTGQIKEQIHYAGIIPPENLPAFSACFDVGLATETGTPLNRNICLTNKIFTYLLAGNCILASDTEAQRDFMNSYKSIGLLYKNGDLKDLTEKINILYKDRSLLRKYKKRSFDLASTILNWENESKKLLNVIEELDFSSKFCRKIDLTKNQ